MSIKGKTLNFKNWAVVGATNKKNKYSYKIVKTLKENGYNVYPINPEFEEIAGLKCYDKLSSVEHNIDVVDLIVKPEIGIKIMKEIKELKIENVWLQPGARSKEIKKFAAENKINIVEDSIYKSLNCICARLK